MCYIEERLYDERIISAAPQTLSNKTECQVPFVVSLTDAVAKKTSVSGGKGASLAALVLQSASAPLEDAHFKVPDAVIVTTAAWEHQLSTMADFEAKIGELNAASSSSSSSSAGGGGGELLEAQCAHFVAWFKQAALAAEIVDRLKHQLTATFGAAADSDLEQGWSALRFAVRSSATTIEDSSEMSAAGQMDTFLGVPGSLEVLSRAVIACWASQFSFASVQYKRGYGQWPVAGPMAVVVQRMVACRSSGVLFTAHPVTGDERELLVTANFGLGESVVSAAAEPDTFTLEVEVTANSYQAERRVTGVKNKELGRKALVVRMKKKRTSKTAENLAEEEDSLKVANLESCGTLSEELTGGELMQSVSDEDLLRLGRAAVHIAASCGSPRDIEFGFADPIKDADDDEENDDGGDGGKVDSAGKPKPHPSLQLYVFQSRPITALDSNFTAYEVMHEMDTAHMTEFEIYTRHHVGEIVPGAYSWGGFFSICPDFVLIVSLAIFLLSFVFLILIYIFFLLATASDGRDGHWKGADVQSLSLSSGQFLQSSLL